VIGRCAFHTVRQPITSAPQIPRSYHHPNFRLEAVNGSDLTGHQIGAVRINPKTLGARKRFSTEFQDDPLISR
jgi:hypothetical protein